MIDIETMGVRPNSAVVSIGAVAFEPMNLDTVDSIMLDNRAFYVVLNLGKQKTRHFDPGTIYWWLKQSPEAQKAVLGGEEGVAPYGALMSLNGFIRKHSTKISWCLGATFDHVIVEDLYRDAGLDNPVQYHKQYCMRTLAGVLLVDRPKIPELVGHNALDDAIKQTIWLQMCFRELNGVTG